MDAKYKLYAGTVPPADIYQSFVYAFAYGLKDAGQMPTSVLIYPASSGAHERVHLQVRRNSVPGGEVLAVGVPIAGVLDEIGLGIVGDVGSVVLETFRSRLPGILCDRHGPPGHTGA